MSKSVAMRSTAGYGIVNSDRASAVSAVWNPPPKMKYCVGPPKVIAASAAAHSPAR